MAKKNINAMMKKKYVSNRNGNTTTFFFKSGLVAIVKVYDK